MKQALVLAALGGAAALIAYMFLERPSQITITDALAAPSVDGAALMVTMTLENAGGADRLVGVGAPGMELASLMNPGAPDAALVVPGDSTAQLAMDGAHLRLHMADDLPEAGSLIPVTLRFDRGGEMATRARVMPARDTAHAAHGSAAGVLADPAPQLGLNLTSEPGRDGVSVLLDLRNLVLKPVEDGSAHVPGEGHGHVYLNGLKLGRLYAEEFETGALLPGSYVLEVALNTHDHRPYLDVNGPVVARLPFVVPD